ncbi:MAG: ROK family protein, partial [Ardenticatenia bacterium]|nr:ROK family protein [Ardenticatenia bacterium]
MRAHRAGRGWSGLVVGLDVGGTKTDVVLVNESGGVISAMRFPTPTGSGAHVAEGILTGVRLVLEKAGAVLEDVSAVGIGVPGQVESGTVRRAVNLGIEEFPLAQHVADHVGREVAVIVENDVYAAALGAYDLLSRQAPVRHMVYLGVGTGISAGVVLAGDLYRGAHGMAGEIGHVVVDPEGEPCNCGARGCLETVASGPALARQAKAAVAAGRATRLGDLRPLDAPAVFRAAREGDSVALKIVERGGYYLAKAVQWLLLCYDVDKVVLGGGLAHEGAFISITRYVSEFPYPYSSFFFFQLFPFFFFFSFFVYIIFPFFF